MSADVLTVNQAASVTGRSYGQIVHACYSGKLPARKGRIEGYDKKQVWLIRPPDLQAWISQHQPAPPSEIWTDADIEALRELVDGCSDAQIALYLQRTIPAVKTKLRALYQAGELDRRRATSLIPFQCPASGIWVAKTCPYCGKLRDASQYTMKVNAKGKSYPLTMCHQCGIATMKQTPPRADQDKKRERDQARQRALQEITVAQAEQSHQEYTSTELEVLTDTDKSTLQVALELHRTYAGVSSKRSAMGFRCKKELREYGHWIINFPNAMHALREHFRVLGEPVPEELWDWNDKENAA